MQLCPCRSKTLLSAGKRLITSSGTALLAQILAFHRMVMVLMTTLSLSVSESLSYCVFPASQSQQQPIQDVTCSDTQCCATMLHAIFLISFCTIMCTRVCIHCQIQLICTVSLQVAFDVTWPCWHHMQGRHLWFGVLAGGDVHRGALGHRGPHPQGL